VELDDQSLQVAEPRPGSWHFDDPIDQILAELDLQKMFGTLSEDQERTHATVFQRPSLETVWIPGAV
jgi:hypothetical protein